MSESSWERELENEAEIAREQAGEQGEQGEPEPPPSPVAAQRKRKTRAILPDSEEETTDEGSAEDDDDDDEGESMDEEDLGARGRDRFRRNVHEDARSDADSQDLGGGGSSRRGAQSTSARLHQGLDEVPGYCDEIMGLNIDPIPPCFETGVPDYWTQWNNDAFGIGQKIRPVRVLKVGFIAKWQMAKDAEYVGDIETQSDELAQSRTIATCAMLGLQTMGTAKGFICSKNHSEITNAQAAGQGAMVHLAP